MNPQQENLTLFQLIVKLHQDYPVAFTIFYAVVALCIVAVIVGLWLFFGSGPRRRRGLRTARKLLAAGDWKAALDQLKKTSAIGSPSKAWLKTFDEFEAECLQAATTAALKDKKFEEALNFGQKAAKILDGQEHEVRGVVQAAMLKEIRRLFSKTGETENVQSLIVRTLAVQSPCREASFWRAMCDIRNGALESALLNLQAARTGQVRPTSLDDVPAEPGAEPAPPSPFIDPSLYLGAVLLRTGQAKESLRFLTEANRMDSNCPFVRLQLGAAIVAAGGDTKMAVRNLQAALGPKGLGQWQNAVQRAWVDGFPENRSYVRKLASEVWFSCPLFGDDMKYLIRQGNLALAQGHFKLNNFAEAAEMFDKVLKEGAPSLPVLRGLGLSLAKLGRFDDAFIHLRTAHEMEEVKDRITAGYLALCGAGGKPARPQDKLDNLAWAIRLVTQFNAPGDAEWVGLLNRIFAETRQNGITISSDDQLYLCEHLVSLQSADKVSAEAYHYLMATEPALIQDEYAWLYCRADQQHEVGGDQAMALYTRTFSNADGARTYFSERGWELDDVELMFLRRAAERAPGRFPEVLGADYLPRGEQLLLEQAQRLEQAGQSDAALQTIEILVKLSPNNTSAMDRAAGLHFRAKRPEPAYELLEQWHRAQPDEPLPLVRQALLLHQQGHDDGCFDKLRKAMALSTGRRRANIAFLGARVALQSYLLPNTQANGSDTLPTVQAFLRDCLANDAGHPHALWCLAGVRWLHGDAAALAEQAKDMTNAEVADPRYHYLAAVCHLLGGQMEAVVQACERVGKPAATNGSIASKHLAVEAGYLAAIAQIALGRPEPAIDALRLVTYNPNSPTLSLAQGLLGNVLFREGRHEEAIAAWEALEAEKRKAWGLNDPLAQTTFISALESLQKAEYEVAAEKFRQSGKLGYRDRRLGPLLVLSLFKAGQQAIYAGDTAPVAVQEEIKSQVLSNELVPTGTTPQTSTNHENTKE